MPIFSVTQFLFFYIPRSADVRGDFHIHSATHNVILTSLVGGGFQKVCMTSNCGKILKSYLTRNISPTLLSNSNWKLWYNTAQCLSQAISSSAVKYFETALISFKRKIPLQRLISIIKLSTIEKQLFLHSVVVSP